MASGTIYGGWHSNGQYRIKIKWSSTPNEANVRSTVTVKTYLDADWDVSYSARKYGSTTCNGSTDSWYDDTNHSGTGEWLLNTETYTVYHDSETGKKSINISSWFEINITLGSGAWVGRLSASGTATLDTIDTCNVYYGSGGSWKKGKAVYYGTGGSWKKASSVYYGTGGSWKK